MPPGHTNRVALSGEPPRTGLGLVTYCFEIAKRARAEIPELPNLADPFTFIQHARSLGAGAVQIPFGILLADEIRRIRDFSGLHQIELESTVACPKSDADLDRFAAELKTLRELGVLIARTVIFPGRRYEQFPSLAEYREAERAARAALRRAIPVAERHRICLALENHKDQRADERWRLLREFDCEALGVCLDVGNNIALLEDPADVAEAFATRTVTVHFKDQGIREDKQGFLLADVPLGAGCIDLPRIVSIIRKEQPHIRFHLELITRDPLLVPVLQDSYWTTLGEVRAPQLARQLASLKRLASSQPFPAVSSLPPLERVEIERRNIEQSLAYAARHLGFSA